MLRLRKVQTNSGSFKKGLTPWIKGKKHSEETKRKIREARARQVFTEESRRKMSQRMIGRKNPFYRKKHSEKSKRKMSESLKGKKPWNKGKKMSKESRKKSSKTHKKRYAAGAVPWNKDKKMSKESRKKSSKTHKKRYAEGAVPWNKGKNGVYSKAILKKMSEGKKGQTAWNKGKMGVMPSGVNHHMYGKKHSEKSKRKISESLKCKKPWNKGKKGVMPVPWMKGKKMSEEAKRKFKETMQKRYPDGIKISEETRGKLRTSRLSQVFPVKDTKLEKTLQRLLKDREIKFETHRTYIKRGLKIYGQPDIFIKPNIMIYADGDYWHGNPNPWLKGKNWVAGFKADDYIISNLSAKDKWARDKQVTDTLKKSGYIVLRFWETEIKLNPEKCLQEIIKIIKESRR